jgi:diguanylate cyclase (GGDEF)-like protein
MDIDNFKHINDEFGHSIGDKVIREVADVLKNTFRDRDIVFRLGGDEYAVYAFGIDNEELGETVIKRVFDEIEIFDIPELNGHKVSISVGAVIVDPAKNLNFEDAYRQADAGVYESKKVDGSAVSFYKG